MEQIKLKLKLTGQYETVAPHAQVTLNDNVIFDAIVNGTSVIVQSATLENESVNKLKITLLDKKDEHTEIDEQGNILKDSQLTIEECTIEDVDLIPNFSLIQEKFYYEHSGSKHQLYNTLGINGSAVIEFDTPFYVWLLENI